MKKVYQSKNAFSAKNVFKALAICLFFCFQCTVAVAQCPPNIDYELGDFAGWKLWTGTHYLLTATHDTIALPTQVPLPLAGSHEMLSATPGNGIDSYGLFPQNCPNGSGHSIKLGSTTTLSGISKAQGVSYTFTIPPGQNQFSIVYHYAVVFLESVSNPHTEWEQANFVIEVKNITDDSLIQCSSFSFHATSGVNGFFDSPVNTNVKCKNWAATSINLDNMAGKTIQVFFKSANCTPAGHWGYAYVDVNTECSSSFVGAVYCHDDTAVNVSAPSGYATYQWWDAADPTQTIIGTTQTINFNPPPIPGSIYNVAVTPYADYGCNSVFSAQMLDTLAINAFAGSDGLSCQNAPVQLGAPPKATYVYSWNPTTGLNDPNISNPIATPSVTTTYVLTVRSAGGGCLSTDTVTVKAAVLNTTVNVTGFLTGCITPANPTILKVARGVADSIQWYRNNNPIPGANDTVYNVVQTGTYHVTLFSFQGCDLSSTDVTITVNPTPVAASNHNALVQCFNGHRFDFTNTSTIAFGTMSYNWNMGDGTIFTTPDVSYSYTDTGVYAVKLIVTSDQGCIDSVSYTVVVYESPFSAFYANTRGVCQKINDFIFTNTSTLGAAGYMTWVWDYGDGNTDTTLHGRHYYAQPGIYNVRLTATTEKGCPNDSAFTVTVFPEPQVGFNAPNAEQCFGGNQFVLTNTSTVLTGTMQYLWYMGDGATAYTRDVTYSYGGAGDYMIKMVATTDSGCVDSTAKNVKIFKYAIADFNVGPVCINMRLPLFNQTINTSPSVLTYLWDFGNGATSTLQNPVYSYPAPGTYPVQLTVSNINCPATTSVKQITVTVDEPARGIRYPDVEAVMNFPEQLQAGRLPTVLCGCLLQILISQPATGQILKGLNRSCTRFS